MKHRYYEELISRLIDNDINENEKHTLETHMSDCKKCQGIKRDFLSLSSLMKDERIFSIKKPGLNKLFLNAAKIAAVIVFAVALYITFINVNKSKTIEFASDASKNYISLSKAEEYSDKEIFSVLSSYSAEDYNAEENITNDNTFSTYFSYVNDAR